MKTYPTGKVWGGLIIYPGSQRDALMGAFADYQRKGQLDRKSAVISYLAINNDTLFLTLVYFDNVVKPPAFDAFYSLPALVDATRTYDDFSELINGSIPLNVPRLDPINSVRKIALMDFSSGGHGVRQPSFWIKRVTSRWVRFAKTPPLN